MTYEDALEYLTHPWGGARKGSAFFSLATPLGCFRPPLARAAPRDSTALTISRSPYLKANGQSQQLPPPTSKSAKSRPVSTGATGRTWS